VGGQCRGLGSWLAANIVPSIPIAPRRSPLEAFWGELVCDSVQYSVGRIGQHVVQRASAHLVTKSVIDLLGPAIRGSAEVGPFADRSQPPGLAWVVCRDGESDVIDASALADLLRPSAWWREPVSVSEREHWRAGLPRHRQAELRSSSGRVLELDGRRTQWRCAAPNRNATAPRIRIREMERETGFEPATFCLGSRHSAS
jgi:hypothetical protein